MSDPTSFLFKPVGLRNLELARHIMKKANGIYSNLFPAIQPEIEAMQLSDEELPFPYEFICFENDYAAIRIHMHDQQIEHLPVIDIGCQYGFQSAMFEDCDYTGCDRAIAKFFNDHGNYISCSFPDTNLDLSNKIIISNMSLGYFNNEKENITDDTICEALKDTKYLYIATTPELIKILSQYFSEVVYFKDGLFPRCFMRK